jgi:hypothetical protein
MLGLMIAAVGVLFVVWIVSGLGLMRLARRTRALPEFMLGLALLIRAGVGYPLSVVAEFAGEHRALVSLAGAALTNTGMALLNAFTARVFYDRSPGAWLVVGGAAALLAVQAIGYYLALAAAQTPAETIAAVHRWGVGSLALCGMAFGWTGLESLRYDALLRRRVALGLADPVVANRMLLWGLMGSSAVAAVVVDSLLLYGGGEWARSVALPLFTSLMGLLVSVFMLLAFWPPAAYLALVRGRSARAQA